MDDDDRDLFEDNTFKAKAKELKAKAKEARGQGQGPSHFIKVW